MLRRRESEPRDRLSWGRLREIPAELRVATDWGRSPAKSGDGARATDCASRQRRNQAEQRTAGARLAEFFARLLLRDRWPPMQRS